MKKNIAIKLDEECCCLNNCRLFNYTDDIIVVVGQVAEDFVDLKGRKMEKGSWVITSPVNKSDLRNDIFETLNMNKYQVLSYVDKDTAMPSFLIEGTIQKFVSIAKKENANLAEIDIKNIKRNIVNQFFGIDTAENKEPRIENWKKIYVGEDYFLVGEVSGHPDPSVKDGDYITLKMSKFVNKNGEAKYEGTFNGNRILYSLGEELSDDAHLSKNVSKASLQIRVWELMRKNGCKINMDKINCIVDLQFKGGMPKEKIQKLLSAVRKGNCGEVESFLEERIPQNILNTCFVGAFREMDKDMMDLLEKRAGFLPTKTTIEYVNCAIQEETFPDKAEEMYSMAKKIFGDKADAIEEPVHRSFQDNPSYQQTRLPQFAM